MSALGDEKVKITFVVKGPPVPKARARVATDPATGKTHAYTPKRTSAYSDLVGMLALSARQKCKDWPRPDDKAPRFGLKVFVFWAEHEGDWDNYGKIVGDACNKILWRDDKQISWGCAWKDKVPKGQERIEVEAWVIGSNG